MPWPPIYFSTVIEKWEAKKAIKEGENEISFGIHCACYNPNVNSINEHNHFQYNKDY